MQTKNPSKTLIGLPMSPKINRGTGLILSVVETLIISRNFRGRNFPVNDLFCGISLNDKVVLSLL